MSRLLRRARHGDEEAFIKLFDQHKVVLWKTAIAVLDNSTDAEDALQETMLKAWKGISNFKERSNIRTWLTRILLRTCYDFFRKRKQEPPTTPFTLLESRIESEDYRVEADGYDDKSMQQIDIIPEQGSINEQAKEGSAMQAMGKLSKEDRLVLTLFYLNEYSIKEIAQSLQISAGAVKTRLSRARSRIRRIYKQDQAQKAEVLKCATYQ